MVIDGHVDNGFGLAGVFNNLQKAEAGDEIIVTTKEGGRYRYVVTSLQTYDYKQVPVESIFSTSGAPRLAIITCDGAWIAGEKTYDRRLVVYAELRSE